MIMPDVTVGKFSVLSAGSVLTKSIPDKVIARGLPAKAVKKIDLDCFQK